MSRQEARKKVAQGALLAGLGQLFAGGAAMLRAIDERQLNELRQQTALRLQEEQLKYQKDRDSKTDVFRNKQLQAQTNTAESSQALERDKLTHSKQMNFVQGVQSQLNGFNKQLADVQERVTLGEITPEQAQAMSQSVLQKKNQFVHQVGKKSADQLQGTQLAYLVDDANSIERRIAQLKQAQQPQPVKAGGFTPQPLQGDQQKRLALIEQLTQAPVGLPSQAPQQGQPTVGMRMPGGLAAGLDDKQKQDALTFMGVNAPPAEPDQYTYNRNRYNSQL